MNRRRFLGIGLLGSLLLPLASSADLDSPAENLRELPEHCSVFVAQMKVPPHTLPHCLPGRYRYGRRPLLPDARTKIGSQHRLA